jgi:hypothetical protein
MSLLPWMIFPRDAHRHSRADNKLIGTPLLLMFILGGGEVRYCDLGFGGMVLTTSSFVSNVSLILQK